MKNFSYVIYPYFFSFLFFFFRGHFFFFFTETAKTISLMGSPNEKKRQEKTKKTKRKEKNRKIYMQAHNDIPKEDKKMNEKEWKEIGQALNGKQVDIWYFNRSKILGARYFGGTLRFGQDLVEYETTFDDCDAPLTKIDEIDYKKIETITERTDERQDEDIESQKRCEAHQFDETNDCDQPAGKHVLSYVYPQDCQLIRNGGGSPQAFLCTISICDDCHRYYKGGDRELENVEDIRWADEYVLDYHEVL